MDVPLQFPSYFLAISISAFEPILSCQLFALAMRFIIVDSSLVSYTVLHNNTMRAPFLVAKFTDKVIPVGFEYPSSTIWLPLLEIRLN